MDPATGQILALTSLPSYLPEDYKKYPPENYRIPAIADTYEPGSTFKTVVMASALDAGVIKPDDVCADPCQGPVQIGKYQIKTWDNHYFPGQTMTEILERSDNVGMVYVGSLIGKSAFAKYLHDFGIGQPTHIDLEAETVPKLKSSWGDIDLATASFGQGLAVTSIEMVSAVGAIANGGTLMEPHIVTAVRSSDQTIPIPPKRVRQVIKPQTAREMTAMMVKSAQHGEANWTIPEGYQIAGKTGTAQVPIAGHYDTENTIASFIGFAPADKPRFVMLVKLKAPQSSPWASETAAPLWFKIMTDILHYANIPPQ